MTTKKYYAEVGELRAITAKELFAKYQGTLPSSYTARNLTTSMVARIMCVDRSTVAFWARTKLLKCELHNYHWEGTYRLYSLEDIADFIEANNGRRIFNGNRHDWWKGTEGTAGRTPSAIKQKTIRDRRRFNHAKEND